MTDSAPAIFVALESSGIGAAIRQSRWLYMVANIVHIASLAVFAGALAVMDTRLAGGLAATAPGRLIGRARVVAVAAFLALVVSGATLFTAEASHVILNSAFQIKLALIFIGLINVAWVEWSVMPRITDAPPNTPMPVDARAGALISVTLWLGVAICGRAIAYF